MPDLDKTGDKTGEKPHYHGHRDRLRRRFMDKGEGALADYEILELLLFTAIPRRDVKELAKMMLAKFGSLSGVLNAEAAELQQLPGLSESTAAFIRAMQAFLHRSLRQEVMHKPILNNWARLMDYCQTTMAHEKKEHFRLLFLNKKNELIADEVQGIGTVDHTPAYPREVMRRALEVGATAIILVHNHPSGDPTPSRADIEMTLAIKAAGAPFEIVIHDHLIVSSKGISSFKTLGIL